MSLFDYYEQEATEDGSWNWYYCSMLTENTLDQYGFVTTKDAKKLGVPAVELRSRADGAVHEHRFVR